MTSESTESGSAQRDVYTGSLHDPNAPKDDDSSPLPANFAASEALESSGVTSSEPSNIPETIPTQITTATYLNSSAAGFNASASSAYHGGGNFYGEAPGDQSKKEDK